MEAWPPVQAIIATDGVFETNILQSHAVSLQKWLSDKGNRARLSLRERVSITSSFVQHRAPGLPSWGCYHKI
jgi:hypothetical protein